MLWSYFQMYLSCLKQNVNLTFYDHFWILLFSQDNPRRCRQYYKLYKRTNISLWLWCHEMNLQVIDLIPEHLETSLEAVESLYTILVHILWQFFTFQTQFWMFHNVMLSATSFVLKLNDICVLFLAVRFQQIFDYPFLIKFIVSS